MRINFKVLSLIFGPLFLWLIPSYAIYVTYTHYWASLLIPFMGFYPGPTNGSFYWHHHALSEGLLVIWGVLAVVGYVLFAFYALRTNSRIVATSLATLITISALLIFFRVNFLGY